MYAILSSCGRTRQALETSFRDMGARIRKMRDMRAVSAVTVASVLCDEALTRSRNRKIGGKSSLA
jgi:hypothetical protein